MIDLLKQAVEQVNYYEAAEGQTYFKEVSRRREAHENLRRVAREYERQHGTLALREALGQMGPLLFDVAWIIGEVV